MNLCDTIVSRLFRIHCQHKPSLTTVVSTKHPWDRCYGIGLGRFASWFANTTAAEEHKQPTVREHNRPSREDEQATVREHDQPTRGSRRNCVCQGRQSSTPPTASTSADERGLSAFPKVTHHHQLAILLPMSFQFSSGFLFL